jgi:hypothetical protein
MRSFTSGFERHPALGAATALLGGCLAIGSMAEGVVRVGFDRISRTQRRMVLEHEEALAPRPPAPRQSVLFVGNSLLLEGVEFDVVHASLAPKWDARRFVVEQTAFNDWYYGLRRLFEEGARPDLVVITLTPGQWIGDELRGDYSAHYMMTAGDAARAAVALQMRPTQAASFVLASLSHFWATRVEVRNVLLGRLMPELADLMDYSSVVDRTPLRDDAVERVAYERIARCRDLAVRYGAHVAALVPPVLATVDGAAALARAGKRARVHVLAQVASGSYPPDFYRDAGYHLNARGAHAFTQALTRSLDVELRAALDPTAGTSRRGRPTASAVSRQRVVNRLEHQAPLVLTAVGLAIAPGGTDRP